MKGNVMESKLKQQCQDSVGELPNLLLREGGYPHLPTTPIKQEPKYDAWNDAYLKPTCTSVYQRLYDKVETDLYCKFKDGFWYMPSMYVDRASDETEVAMMQNLPWREVQP